MVCTLLDHRNEVKMFKTFQWNHSPAACGFTWVLNILTLFLWSILEYRGIENSWHFELLITSSHTVHTMNVNQLVESISHLQAWLDTNLLINPRTYMQILHTPHRGTSRGGGVEGTPSKSFWYVAVFQTDFVFSAQSLIYQFSQKDEVYFMGDGPAGGLWRHQQWSQSWLRSWILPRIRNQVKTKINGNSSVLNM